MDWRRGGVELDHDRFGAALAGRAPHAAGTALRAGHRAGVEINIEPGGVIAGPGSGLGGHVGQHRGDQFDTEPVGGLHQQIGRRVAGIEQMLLIGSARLPEISNWGDGPADADGRHVIVPTRGQVGLTRVDIWSQTMPSVGQIVFDGLLDLDDYTIFVGDIERIGRWTQRIPRTGPQ